MPNNYACASAREVLGWRLSWCRRRVGVTQVYVALQLGRSREWVSAVERGAADVPALLLVSWAGVLGVGVGELLDGVEVDAA